MEFLFEKLDVYKLSLDILDAIDGTIEKIRGRFPAARIDQLARASLSITLNIAEGSGRRRPGERGQFFAIARASGFECAALLQVMMRKKLIESEDYANKTRQLMSLTKMLSGLIAHTERKMVEKN